MTFHSTRQQRRRVQGNVSRPGNKSDTKSPRVQCAFDPETFAMIADESERRNLPFAAIVRELVDMVLRWRG